VTICQTLLSRGYFPKEFPPAFFSEQFARYATTKAGRKVLSTYKPPGAIANLMNVLKADGFAPSASDETYSV
jgi:hypothetical protein